MLQWLGNNLEAIAKILGAIVALLTLATPLLIKSGWIRGKLLKVLIAIFEDLKGIVVRTLKETKKAKKDGELTDDEIAEALEKALKGEARERAIKTGLRSITDKLRDDAAEIDPKEEKKPASRLRKFGGIIRSIIPGLGG